MTRLRLVLVLGLAVMLRPGVGAQMVTNTVTHGPMLGRPGATHMAVWARTQRAGTFTVRYGLAPDQMTLVSPPAATTIEHDFAASVMLTGLRPNTRYYYQVVPAGNPKLPLAADGSFLTLPDAEAYRNAEHNPKGLFNFRFEFGTGNNQNPTGPGPWPPAFKTMLDRLHGKVQFAIQNGDFIYEEGRAHTADAWRADVGLAAGQPSPRSVELAPAIVGVWQNYKIYLERGKALAAWHRNVPSLFTFDDHEIIDNIEGTANVGRRDRKATFRDIGTQAWYDYLGWSNPVAPGQIRMGRVQLTAGSDVLVDPQADFIKEPVAVGEPGALHIHWGGPLAGVPNREFTDAPEAQGHPSAGVYQVVEVLDAHRLRITPAPPAGGTVTYSLGRASYYDQRVGNAHFFVLDTRGYRNIGDVKNPRRTDISMLGARQKAWLKDAMAKSDAEMFFVVSQVTFMIPHVGGTPTGAGSATAVPTEVVHDEAWPVFLAEREELVAFWEGLRKPVMILTGDLHNSFSIKITDRIWEFASGPHNSRNHRADAQGMAKPNGPYDSRGRNVDIRWSSYFLPDVPAPLVRQPIYTVVQVNNVFNNRLEASTDRWVAFPYPQVIVQFFDGFTGDLLYSESVLVGR